MIAKAAFTARWISLLPARASTPLAFLHSSPVNPQFPRQFRPLVATSEGALRWRWPAEFLIPSARMNTRLIACLSAALAAGSVVAQVPDNLVVEGVPPIPPELKASAGRYLESRAAGFSDWHPQHREILITTRFADAAQLHIVKSPGGARRQLTFYSEPVGGGLYDPVAGAFVVFAQDSGGGEFFQFYRQDFADGRVTLLTDGKSRNTGPRWSNTGRLLAYTSTRRNGRDTDLYVMNPREPGSDRLLAQVEGGG